MLTRLIKQDTRPSLTVVYFEDTALHTLLKQSQTTGMSVDKLLTDYYLILTASGEIYDDYGEDFSLEKIRSAVSNKSRLVKKSNQTGEELIESYRTSPEAKYTNTAALIKIQSIKSAFDPKQFSIKSCSIFTTKPEIDKRKTDVSSQQLKPHASQ